MNLPNIITVIRILIVPLFVIFLQKDLFFLSLIVFTIAAISDGLDGLLARYLNQRTTLGAYLDPIADKMLMASAFVTLTILKIIPFWLSVIVISRDILIMTGIIIYTVADIKVEIKPSLLSKWTTFFQLLTVFIVLLCQVIPPEIPETFSCFLFGFTSTITILSGL
ncbi:MAG: CDP-diacylglycerol--glycerol-3-phosphate 3-phosphatidyltransferase, partial [Deltaproteobacteria bacterium]